MSSLAVEDRARILRAHGAEGGVVDELLELNRRRITPPAGPVMLPLSDEPHVAAWRGYRRRASTAGVWPELEKRLVQLRFPVRSGISREPAYLAATRRGEWPDPSSPGLELERPERLELELHPSAGGTVPVLVAGSRGDFEALACALSARNEPIDIPPAMGACLVSGLNNWDRVRQHRARWHEADPAAHDEAAWAAEFRRLIPRKAAYQDRLILLSRGPYSGVAAEELGLEPERWLERSLVIRREHELTHYLALRVFGALQHNVVEELVADFAGIVAGFGEYRQEVAARLLGLEAFPLYRAGGRLENYRGRPPVSEAGFRVVQSLARDAVTTLDRLWTARSRQLRQPAALGRMVLRLAGRTLEELAADQLR